MSGGEIRAAPLKEEGQGIRSPDSKLRIGLDLPTKKSFEKDLTPNKNCAILKMFQGKEQRKEREGKLKTNQKGLYHMKISTLTAISAVLSSIDFANKDAIMSELSTELHRNDAVKEAKAALYEAAKPIVMEVFEQTDAPLSVAEIWEAIEGNVPDGFTKSKLSYALSRLWGDSVKAEKGRVMGYTKA